MKRTHSAAFDEALATAIDHIEPEIEPENSGSSSSSDSDSE